MNVTIYAHEKHSNSVETINVRINYIFVLASQDKWFVYIFNTLQNLIVAPALHAFMHLRHDEHQDKTTFLCHTHEHSYLWHKFLITQSKLNYPFEYCSE